MAIVVGYLPTVEGRAALDGAMAEARLRRSPVVVVASVLPGAEAGQREALDGALAEVGEELAAAGIAHQLRVTDGGDVADDILQAAQDVDADLIVLGLRRRSHVGKLILGTNAQRVLFDAPCPVLTVKPQPA